MFDSILQNTGMSGPQGAQSGLNWQAMNDPQALASVYQMFGGPQYWASQGYTGPNPNSTTLDSITGDVVPADSAGFLKFLKDKGYGYNFATDPSAFRYGQLTQNGQQVGDVSKWSEPDNGGFNAVRALVSAGLLAAGGAAAAGGGAGAGAGGTGVAGGSAATGNMALIDSGLGTAGYGASSAGTIAPGAVGAAGGAGTDFGSMYSNYDFTPADTAGDLSSQASGSDAHFYQGGSDNGTGLQDLGNMGGAGSQTVPTLNLSGGSNTPGFWNSLSNGNWGDAASAAGNWATSPSGLQTLGGLGSALINSHAAGNALDAQRSATDQANALQKYMFDTTRADWAPYRALGQQGLTGYSNLLNDPSKITQDPGYQFGLNQGQTAIDRSAASKGGLYSGATLKALQRYGQDYGGTKYGEALNRFGNAAQLGATGVSGSQAAGSNYANQAGANTTGFGNAAAGNALYNGYNWTNALNGAVSSYRNQP